jgi:hypothetical protein
VQGLGPGLLYDVSRYVDLFTQVPQKGGVKANPLDVVLIGIDAPEEPFEVILSNPGTAPGSPFEPCYGFDEESSPPCVPVLQHSCVLNENSAVFGDPAVRINTVIRAAKKNAISSICQSSYGDALGTAAREVVSSLGGGCVPALLPLDDGGATRPDCTVEDVIQNPDGSSTLQSVPQCPGNGANPGPTPCWRIEAKPDCAQLSPDGVGLTIERAGQPAPPHTTARVQCRTAK